MHMVSFRSPVRLFRRAALLAILTCTSLQSAAATWVEVGVATNGVKALVDTDTIAAKSGRVEVQQRFVLPAGATGRIAYVDQRVVYSCRSETVQTLKSTEFDAAGRVLRQEGPQQNPIYKVLEGTLPRYILEALC
jgi:hypothetical protein